MFDGAAAGDVGGDVGSAMGEAEMGSASTATLVRDASPVTSASEYAEAPVEEPDEEDEIEAHIRRFFGNEDEDADERQGPKTNSPRNAGAPSEAAEAPEVAALKAQIEALKPFQPVIDRLKREGVLDAQAVQSRLAEAERSQALQGHMRTVEGHIRNLVNSGNITPDMAGKLWDAQRVHWESQLAVRQQQEAMATFQREQAYSRAFAAHPSIRESGAEPLIRALGDSEMAEPGHATRLLAQIVDEAGQRAVAAYVAKQSRNGKASASVGSAGGVPPAANDVRAAASRSWASLLGIK